MTTLTLEKQTLGLQGGQVLTVTTAAHSSAMVVRLSDIPGGEPQTVSFMAANEEQPFGPFAAPTRYSVEALTGSLSYSMALSVGGGGSAASVAFSPFAGVTATDTQTAIEQVTALIPYAIGAVHFYGGTSALMSEALTCTDSGDLSLSFWFRAPAPGGASPIFTVDPANYGTFGSNGGAGAISFAVDNGDNSENYSVDSTAPAYDGLWHHVLAAFKADTAGTGAAQAVICIDGVDVTGALQNNINPAFDIAISGRPFWLGEDSFGAGTQMDIADFWFAPGQSLLVDGLIPTDTILKFATSDGSPVDLGEDGSTPTGIAPAIFFHRADGAAASTFTTNRGTGGVFTVVGDITAVDARPKFKIDVGFANPMTATGDMIGGGTSGAAVRLANPGAGTFNLQSIDGVLTWTAV